MPKLKWRISGAPKTSEIEFANPRRATDEHLSITAIERSTSNDVLTHAEPSAHSRSGGLYNWNTQHACRTHDSHHTSNSA